jgi:tetraprenyl-beta-curcumene synthase
MTGVGDVWAPVALVAEYYATVARHVRDELGHWRRRAAAIPDPRLRRFALEKLEGEHMNAQAAAVYATLVPLRQRAVAARLMVAFELMYDYLDAVSEQPADEPIANGLKLHGALLAAVVEQHRAPRDHYALSGFDGDGGYLDEIAQACRARLGALPAVDAIRPVLLRSVARCGEGQTRTHAARQAGRGQLRDFGRSLGGDAAYAWWELTAGAASSLVLHALFAVAGDARTTPAVASQIERAYFPAICALSTLLDAFIDRASDAATATDNYLDYCHDSATAVQRLAKIAGDAEHAARDLPRGDRHAAITAGVAAFYLSAVLGAGPTDKSAVPQIIEGLRPGTIHPLLTLLRWKRRVEGG